MMLAEIVDLDQHPIGDPAFLQASKKTLDESGVLVLRGFIQEDTLDVIRSQSRAAEENAYFCTQKHSVYLAPADPAYGPEHPANRQVTSSKGCVCDDQIGSDSPLRHLYDQSEFQTFLSKTTGQAALFPYADPLSSINVHYAQRGQELGWHFDNSSFAVTLLIQKPDAGSRFEYIPALRNADEGEKNFDGVASLLDGVTAPRVLPMEEGSLVLFRGRNSIHRVSPNESDKTRILAVLAYNDTPGVALSESARMTFYGRLT